MKILIVSDTHGLDGNLEKAVVRESPFDYLIHCGDVEGREDSIQAFVECPCCMVSGNNDFFSDLPREEFLQLAGKKIMVTHGHSYGVSLDIGGLVDEARYRECDIVLFGHTHRPETTVREGVLAVNPGSLNYPRQKGRLPSYGVMELEEGREPEVEIRFLR
ncbi:MAG: metallophosphoesterase [Clostridiales bacterium]|nr:metallophosphoesterase [Clostridiales bacterium]